MSLSQIIAAAQSFECVSTIFLGSVVGLTDGETPVSELGQVTRPTQLLVKDTRLHHDA
jgi:hypothetical protein